ncbi:MAG: beta-lactamase family protein [Chitinophagales bacterium]|nr:beta-lactamase family protein [Chitinophagales bacterium]
MTNQLILTTALIFLCFCCVEAQQTESVEARVDRIFKDFNNAHTPGVMLACMKNGKVLFSKGYGMANLEYQIPISSSSVFSLASVSKQFTAFSILLLEEREQLSLNDDVRKYLPKLNDYGEVITIEMLINHTSGIRSCLQLLGQAGYNSDNIITSEEVRDMIYRQSALNFPPGEKFSYSNSGYFLLAEIVEKVSGKSFANFVNENIFKPLKMEDSFVMDNYNEIIHDRATSYQLEGDLFVNAPANYSYYGSTNLYTTITDLSKWVLNFEEQNVGSEQTLQKMNELSPTENKYSYGQFVGNFNGLKQIYHGGADAGYRTYLARFPNQNVAVFLLSNNGTINAQGKAQEVADVFLHTFYTIAEADLTPTSENRVIELPTSSLKKYEGNYLDFDNYITRNISVRDNKLIYSRPEQNNRETSLLPLSLTSFQFENASDVTAVFDTILNSIKIIVDGEKVEEYNAFEPKSYSEEELKEFEGSFYSEDLDTKYKLKLQEGKLIVMHSKMDPIVLNAIKADGFMSLGWQFRVLEFERDRNNEIIGFYISSDRAKKVKFKKLS